MEKAILEKLQQKDPQADSDALDFIMDSAKEQGKELSMQELKVSPASDLGHPCPLPTSSGDKSAPEHVQRDVQPIPAPRF